MSSMPLKVPLTATNTARLLDMLCEDDAFRSQFAIDPSGALAEHGLHEITGARCAPLATLATKEEFQAARITLQSLIARTGSFTVPHYFEAGSMYTSTSFIAAA